MKGRENKPHIGVFGRKIMGKVLINAITQQEIAIVPRARYDNRPRKNLSKSLVFVL